jgi:hypothetical protein
MGVQKIALAMERLKPRVLPADYTLLEDYPNAAEYYRADGMTIITEVDEYQGRLWLHVSCAFRTKLPSWVDLREVKTVFVGPKRMAISVQPGEDEYVNIHPYVLHLWSPIDHDPIPDFRKFEPLVGKMGI